jgi:hypothetical protein
MAVTLTIAGIAYQYPTVGEEGWGEEATNWAQGVTNLLNVVTAAGDISPTTVTINNNVTTFTSITNLTFDTAVIKGAFIEYNVLRSTSSDNSSETGMMVLSFNSADSAASGSITNISVASQAVITSTSHGLSDGDCIVVTGSNSTPAIDGLQEITYIDANSFSIPVTTSGSGSAGSWTKTRWEFTNFSTETGGINFLITDSGQVQYTTNNMSGTGHTGQIRFRARVIR